MEKERISIEEEVKNIEMDIKILNGIYHVFMNELGNATEKTQRETIKYNILTTLYVLDLEVKRKKEYEKFLPKAPNMSVVPSKETVKDKLQKYLNILKVYRGNDNSIEIIIKHGNIDMLKKQYNLEDESIEYIKYLIDNYKNIYVDSKKIK